MKTNFFRNKRTGIYEIEPLQIKVEKRVKGEFSGVLQSIINIIVYLLIFFLFLRDRMQYMGIFIALMFATTIAQILIRVGKRIEKIEDFPYFKYTSGKKSYSDYLNGLQLRVDKYISDYVSSMGESIVPVQELYHIASDHSEKLWQRMPFHSDYLNLNLGSAFSSIPISITYPNIGYDEKDEQLEQFKSTVESKTINQNRVSLPFTYNLRQKKTISLTCNGVDSGLFCSVLNAIIIDVATMQSPEELIICSLYSPELDIDWVRMLPHVWNGDNRLLYNGSEDKNEFMGMVCDALKNAKKDCIAFIDADYIANYSDSEIYTFFNEDELPDNLYVVFFSVDGRIPNRASEKVSYTIRNGRVVGKLNDYEITPYTAEQDFCERISQKLFNTRLIDSKKKTTSNIPSSITLYDLLEINNPSEYPQWPVDKCPELGKNLKVPVGSSSDGKKVEICISNDGDGNHTYISGTNGSGKTEFIKTFIIGSCLKFSPEYFNFIIVDFSVGAVSSIIKKLPHCAGEFINGKGQVSKRDVTRVATMLKSEYDKRADICKKYGCSDIYDYQRKYFAQSNNPSSELSPLPVLLIVVDEVSVFFAENNKTRDIIDHLATLGRKYGMFLMLAAQPKTGVLSSQTKANVNISIDFYSSDSDEPIKGRATINSLRKKNENCQIAWSTKAPASARLVDFISLSGKSRVLHNNSQLYQLDYAVQEIERRFPNSYYQSRVREVLKQPLEEFFKDESLGLSELWEIYPNWAEKNGAQDRFPVGLADDIYQRQRGIFTLPACVGNLLVYGQARTGKTQFIKTLIASVCNPEHGLSPEDVQFQIVTNAVNEYNGYEFPHVGSILSPNAVYYALLYIQNEMKRRMNVQDISTLPSIILVIDGCYTTIARDNNLSKMLEDIVRDCERNNIYVILTLTNKVSTVMNKAIEYFNNHMVFFMGEDFDYSSVSMHVDLINSIPHSPGHCLLDIKVPGCSEKTLEVQIAEVDSDISEAVHSWNTLWIGKKGASEIPLMPDSIKAKVIGDRVFVGIKGNLEEAYWDFSYSHSYLISYFNNADKNLVLSGITHSAIVAGFNVIIIDNKNADLEQFKSESRVKYFGYNDEAAEQELQSLVSSPMRDSTLLVMNDFAKKLYPGGYRNEQKTLIGTILDLIQSDNHEFYGIFADERESILDGRGGSKKLVQYLEGVKSGLVINNTPRSHFQFAYEGLPYTEQEMLIPVGWGVHVQSEPSRIKLISEVK